MMPVAKSKNFRGSFRRLLGELRPERPLILAVLVLGVISVIFAIVGPEDPRQRDRTSSSRA